MGNWYSDLHGEQALQRMLEEFTEKEMWAVYREGDKYRIRIFEQENQLIIDLYDRHTGEGTDRVFPVGGFSLKEREHIAEQALAYAEQDLPIMWQAIISPLIGGYWDDVEWDVIKVHDIDRSKINPAYYKYLK